MNQLRIFVILIVVVSLATYISGQAFGKNILGSLLLHRRHSTAPPTGRVKLVSQRHAAPRRAAMKKVPETKADAAIPVAKLYPVRSLVPQQQPQNT